MASSNVQENRVESGENSHKKTDEYIKRHEKGRIQAKQRYESNMFIDNAEGEYQSGPESGFQVGVPRGSVTQHSWNDSVIYPGTERDYWVYVPAQYDLAVPAALMVFQDGGCFLNDEIISTVPVLDNLIHKGDIPVMIGIFVNPGHYPGKPIPDYIPDQPRQIEYDTQSDRYVSCLLDEIIPRVMQQYAITDAPDLHAICGFSSGGMAAWTAAWERPDAFRKVISFIGSFNDIHGGHNSPYLVRKTPPKPIRVFLQSGSNDHNLEFGDWALANQTMASALAFAGYDYKFVYGNGGHDLKHANAIFPDVLRWIWRE